MNDGEYVVLKIFKSLIDEGYKSVQAKNQDNKTSG